LTSATTLRNSRADCVAITIAGSNSGRVGLHRRDLSRSRASTSIFSPLIAEDRHVELNLAGGRV
jgi:hypothetical protein